MNKENKLQSFIILYLKGCTMGICDLIPGVSGGTVAFITGIYTELIYSLNKISPKTVIQIFTKNYKLAWENINGNFFLVLGGGILTSILIFSKLISFLLDEHSILLFSFFLGLVLTSSVLLMKDIKGNKKHIITFFLIGTFLAIIITHIPKSHINFEPWFIFLSGIIAISAMILPGVSGSFLLLLLGSYHFLIKALTDLDIVTLITFALGCLVGLLTTSKILNFLLHKFYTNTISLLMGILLGSTYKLWPWKLIYEVTPITHKDGSITYIPILEKNVMPQDFTIITEVEKTLNITAKDPLLLPAISLFILGCTLYFLFHKINQNKITS